MTIDQMVTQAHRRYDVARILRTHAYTQRLFWNAYLNLAEIQRALEGRKLDQLRRDWR